MLRQWNVAWVPQGYTHNPDSSRLEISFDTSLEDEPILLNPSLLLAPHPSLICTHVTGLCSTLYLFQTWESKGINFLSQHHCPVFSHTNRQTQIQHRNSFLHFLPGFNSIFQEYHLKSLLPCCRYFGKLHTSLQYFAQNKILAKPAENI